MSPVRSLARVCLFLCCIGLSSDLALARKKPAQAVRWTADCSGCEFERGEDGRYRWRIKDRDLDLTLMVDSQELSKVRHRLDHVIGAYLTLTYTGSTKFDFPAEVKMQFLRHHNVVVSNLDPTDFSNRLQNEIDTLAFETDREIKKNPDKSDKKLTRTREYEKEVAEFIEFLSTQSLQPATLTPGNPEVHGWVFFSTKNKWIGSLKEHEDFVLQVAGKEHIWEFPFSLPPSEGDLILRKRAE